MHASSRILCVLTVALMARAAWASPLSFSLFAGGNSAPRQGEFGGLGTSFGLSVSSDLHAPYFLSARFQTDKLGSDVAGSHRLIRDEMLGVGENIQGVRAALHLGVLEYVTSVPTEVQHQTQFGYLLAVRYPFVMKSPSENSLWGFSLSPEFTLAGAVDSGRYKPTPAFLLSLDLLAAL